MCNEGESRLGMRRVKKRDGEEGYRGMEMNHNRNFLLCLHLAIISFLEFISRGSFDLRIISTFSVVHRSQYFLPFLHGVPRLTISHFIV